MDEHHVGSVDEVEAVVFNSEPGVDLEFFVKEDTSLNNARELWKVCTDAGGHGILVNPDMLDTKEVARLFLEQKFRQLRRWVANVDGKLIAVNEIVHQLEAVLAGGGPGLPAGYDPQTFRGPPGYFDLEQVVEDEELNFHIDKMRALILDPTASPGSPLPDDIYRSAEACMGRVLDEQWALAQFNLAYLKVKRDGLATLKAHIQEGIENLEAEFYAQPTHLGCGNAEFIYFQDVNMFPGEHRVE